MGIISGERSNRLCGSFFGHKKTILIYAHSLNSLDEQIINNAENSNNALSNVVEIDQENL